ncbi:glycine--tRNA ligase subunit beta [Sphingomonas sp. C3-2]|uniref:glycine--tRNA ligase subunit beta n=1 Tax=Sphingomonas sp. C3-2 TaxID=3062169 RepID=UPI00294B877D|nr:glycine--tRNA ligase subunit beta [Sphingomonas sp. C3-2]WOK36465.1 glycine--tRNA ligase subunit beta [Sphingomonas sp. C3-2]
MADFLLELLSEEIPARMQEKASADLARLFAEEIGKAGLKPASIESFVTPRRMALIARGLPLETEAVSEERKGPRADAPEQALQGFLKSTGLTREQLVERADNKGNVVLFAVIEKPGRPTAEVIAEAIPAVIRAFPWPKSMRWGAASSSTESLRWVRPLQGIIALLGNDVVPLEVDGVVSGSDTVGHRFHHPGRITIGNADDYAAKLRACHVIVDAAERRRIIADGAAAAASAAGLTLVEDHGLVAENAGLTEWPVPLLGGFDPEFLQVPREVIQLTMRTNQKYFVLNDADGKLAPNFVCTANIAAADGGKLIADGNAKVLAARLSDAKFFWEQDLKVPLEEQAKKLEQIVFHEKLGTVADKVDRIAKLARWLVEGGIIEGANPDQAEQAARLAKADLVTGMVGEFPELQGVMGGYYARAQGLPDAVADAIRDHYKPVGQGDDVPIAPVTVAVSLADKLDTLVAFFFADMPPTGSKDPFALRRAALGVLELVTRNKLRMSLWEAITRGLHGMTTLRCSPDMTDEAFEAHNQAMRATFETLPPFFADRLKVQQREAGVRHDLIDAVFALGGEDDLVRLLARVKALQAFVTTDDGVNLIAGYKRAANILKKEKFEAASVNYEPQAEEAALLAALDAAEPKGAAAVAAEDFEGAMAALASLRAPIDAFFDKVTVNDADPEKRAARLTALARVRDAVHRVADFSKIEG